jgi:hypothetical protein
LCQALRSAIWSICAGKPQNKSNEFKPIQNAGCNLYLQLVNNIQGGHELYDLNLGRVITRARVTQIPVTNLVVKAIEQIAEDQGFKTLKFKNCKGAIFHNADCQSAL